MRAITLLHLFLPALGASRRVYVPPGGAAVDFAAPSLVLKPHWTLQNVAASRFLENFEVHPAAAQLAAPATPDGVPATPASLPSTGVPIQTATTAWVPENLELRQAPVRQAPPGADMLEPPLPLPAPPAVHPAATTTTTVSLGPMTVGTDGISESVTVQWVETWIDGSQTWTPHTITFRFLPYISKAPEPGAGEIGMGTLTGETGKTKTFVVGGVAAQATQIPTWGVAAAVGVGLAGMMA